MPITLAIFSGPSNVHRCSGNFPRFIFSSYTHIELLRFLDRFTSTEVVKEKTHQHLQALLIKRAVMAEDTSKLSRPFSSKIVCFQTLIVANRDNFEVKLAIQCSNFDRFIGIGQMSSSGWPCQLNKGQLFNRGEVWRAKEVASCAQLTTLSKQSAEDLGPLQTPAGHGSSKWHSADLPFSKQSVGDLGPPLPLQSAGRSQKNPSMLKEGMWHYTIYMV